MKIHIVQKGDTLWNLAKKYGVSFDELKKNNSQLSNPDMIMPGMKIKIPGTGSAKQGTIQLGSKKEMPIKGMQQQQMKEKPIAQAPVQQQAQTVKEKPVQMQAPVQPKIQPVKEMPIYQQIQPAPAAQQPVVPDVDVHNYYLVNMANMNVKSPASVPETVQPAQTVQQPQYTQPAPAMQEQPQYLTCEEPCMPMTPMMPGPGFCPPFYPVQPYCPPVAYPYMAVQPMYDGGMHFHESSSHHHAGHHHTHYIQNSVQQVHPGYGAPFMQGQYVPPHGMGHHFESPSHMGMESSTSLFIGTHKGHYGYGQMQQTMDDEDDCGCDGDNTAMPEQYGQTPSYSMNQQNQMMQYQTQAAQEGQQTFAAPYGQQYVQQPVAYYPYQPMGQQAMSGGQQMMMQQPSADQQNMSGGQQMMMQQPSMGQQAMDQGTAYQQHMYGQYQQMPQSAQGMMNWTGQPSYSNADMRSAAPLQQTYNQADRSVSEDQEQPSSGTFDIPDSADEDNE